MRRDVKKRLEKLESALLPKRTRPMIRIIRHEDADGNLIDENGKPIEDDGGPVMVMGRPGPAKDDDPNTLTLTIVDTVVHTRGPAERATPGKVNDGKKESSKNE